MELGNQVGNQVLYHIAKYLIFNPINSTPTQFIMLKLSRPSIVKYIKFGKYEKSHVCNLKKFRIMGGMELNNLCQMFEG